jgi:hypothetical protein
MTKQMFEFLFELIQSFGLKYPNISQIIQLTFLYCFAVIDIIYSVLSTVFALGYYPELLRPFYPLIQDILNSPFLRVWTSPEKIFFLSYVVIELMVIRSIFRFSKLVRYNILLIFALLMIQGLVFSYWDLLFNRQISEPVANWAFDQGALIFTDTDLAVFFFFQTFLLFFCSYLYLYFTAIRGQFFTFPAMNWLTDSISFWLKIKTPTMGFGKRRKKK